MRFMRIYVPCDSLRAVIELCDDFLPFVKKAEIDQHVDEGSIARRHLHFAFRIGLRQLRQGLSPLRPDKFKYQDDCQT